jgi:transposase
MEPIMEATVERCAGLDIHQASVVACVLVGPPGCKPRKEVRTFGTSTRELEALRAWLEGLGVTHVGMESTGVYWKPVHAVLEGRFELIVGNAHHIKAVPGRKTDVKDAEWLADLVRHGLIRPSFVPPPPIRELRDLVRLRRSLAEARSTERNRTLKLLETASIKLASVASEVFGVSGMAMLRALVEGEAAPAEMAELARGKLRSKRERLTLALEGRVTEHHRYVLAFHLRRLAAIEEDLRALDARIEAKAEPFQAQRRLLQEIPGVDALVAITIIAEIGVDMSVFATPAHLASWAGICPGNNASGGKARSGRTRHGPVALKTVLTEAAQAAARTKNTYLGARYHAIRGRRGTFKAVGAIRHDILIAYWHIVTADVGYQDLGVDWVARRHSREHQIARLAKQIEKLGAAVEITMPAA